MNNDDFQRLNYLSEKALQETANSDELKEFNNLLSEWNTSVEQNLFCGLNNIFHESDK